jgi:hypothetical protein
MAGGSARGDFAGEAARGDTDAGGHGCDNYAVVGPCFVSMVLRCCDLIDGRMIQRSD